MDNKNTLAILAVAALMVLPGVVADERNEDGDPFGDLTEDLVCGPLIVEMALEMLEGAAGECSGSPDFDYSHPIFGDGVSCDANDDCQTQVAVALDMPVSDDVDVQSVPLPPVDVQSFGPFVFGPFGSTVASVEGYKDDPDLYCVQVEFFGSPEPPICNSSPLLHQVVPNTGPHEAGEVPQTTVGPTPGFEEGEIFTTPPQHVGKTFLDVEVVAYWNDDRVHRQTFQGDEELWLPVHVQDDEEVQWWSDNPDDTRLEVHYSWHFEDGTPVCADCEGTESVPYLGQVYGAMMRTP